MKIHRQIKNMCIYIKSIELIEEELNKSVNKIENIKSHIQI